MSKFSKIFLVATRISFGALFFYAGLSKILNPEWTAAGYLNNAKNFTGIFEFLASPNILPIVNIINEYSLFLLGVSLILGLLVKYSGLLGAVLMLIYYAALDFPFPNSHAFIVDEHIIYMFTLLYLSSIQAGNIFGLDKYFKK